MEDEKYKYLFPFEKVNPGAEIIVYGAGTLGQDYFRQMQVTGYANILAFADHNYASYPPTLIPVVSPDRICEYKFDYVVIALRMEAAFPEIRKALADRGVPDEKIVCVFERSSDLPSLFIQGAVSGSGAGKIPAYELTGQSVAILATGGFGDMVIQKRFIVELIKFAPECRIDFYNIKAIRFLRHLYSGEENVNDVRADLGSRFIQEKSKYSLALTIEACHFIKVDVWKENVFPKEFCKRIGNLQKAVELENAGITTPAYLTIKRRMFMGLNAYNGFNYNGAFDIYDKNVNIPLESEWKAVFEELALGRYMTVNFGNGDSTDNRLVAKTWKKESFEAVISEFKEKYPGVTVVQLGGESAERLQGVDKYILGEDFRLVVYVMKNSLFHLDIEGGLVHIATQLGTKCIVLFGPTVETYYGYKQNINIQAGACHNCWGLYSDVNRCARGLENPQCMASITPDMVMNAINNYMKEIKWTI